MHLDSIRLQIGAVPQVSNTVADHLFRRMSARMGVDQQMNLPRDVPLDFRRL